MSSQCNVPGCRPVLQARTGLNGFLARAGGAAPDALARPVESLPGVGPAVRRKLARLGIETVGDVLAHRPRRYEEPAPERAIAELFGEEEAVLEVTVRRASGRRRGRLHILTATVADTSGEIRATWFNQPWLEARLAPGTRLRVRGRRNRFGFAVDSYDLGEPVDTAGFAPVYPASEELTQKQLRGIVEGALGYVRAAGDPLSAEILAVEALPSRPDALAALHRPRSLAEAESARRRLALDELLVLQLALARRTADREAATAAALPPPGELARRYRDVLPFRLTPPQERVEEDDVERRRIRAAVVGQVRPLLERGHLSVAHLVQDPARSSSRKSSIRVPCHSPSARKVVAATPA